MAEKSEAVKVMVRLRPFNKRELSGFTDSNEYPVSIVYMHEGSGRVDMLDQDGNPTGDEFEFHETFWSIPESQKQFCSKPFADQQLVFNTVGIDAVENALNGYHTCLFAYGQTGSGKTYTMLGSPSDPGIAPRLVDLLFQRMNEKEGKKGWKYEVDISFMEIYNEK
eukprot:Sspe_Gene.79989::Locus_50295_Transcript_1_1_Confidence_1.000_Length_1052::g.79989::m.79989